MSAQSLHKYFDPEDPPELELSADAEKIWELAKHWAELEAKQAADFAAGRAKDGELARKMAFYAREALYDHLAETI